MFYASVPIHFEFDSAFDTHDSSTEMVFEFNHSFNHEGIDISIVCNSDIKQIVFENINAGHDLEAFIIVKSMMPYIVQLCSIYMQNKNINQLHGHTRLVWFKKEVKIQSQELVHTELSMKVSLENFKGNFDNILTNTEQKFLTQALYGALQNQDIRSKYYSAYTIIERIEEVHRDVGTKRYDKIKVKLLVKSIEQQILDAGFESDNLVDIKGLISGSLIKPTVQNREQKLVMILAEKYAIVKVSFPTPDSEIIVNEELAKKFSLIRNNLFHGKIEGIDESELRHYTNLLILIVTKIAIKDLDL